MPDYAPFDAAALERANRETFRPHRRIDRSASRLFQRPRPVADVGNCLCFRLSSGHYLVVSDAIGTSSL
jgi:hypothetical protein